MPFFTDDNEKKRVWSYCKRHGYDYDNMAVKQAVRDAIREKDASGKSRGHKLEDVVITLPSMIQTADGIRKDIVKPPEPPSEIPEDPTNYHFSGEFSEWYQHYVLPMFGTIAKPHGAIHDQWCEELNTGQYLLMRKPRDHFKTTLISIGYSLYNICEQIRTPVLVVSLADINSRNVYGAIRYNLQNNFPILRDYGKLIDEDRSNTQEMLFLKYQPGAQKDPGLYCSTFGSSDVMGTHPKLAILDDIQDRPLTPAFMNKARILLQSSLIPALGTDGQLVVVGTTKGWNGDNDVYIFCEQSDTFLIYDDPAIYMIDPITGAPLLDANGDMIYNIPPLSDIHREKVQRPLTDARSGRIITYRSGPKKGQPKMWTEYKITILKDRDHYRSIYPEGYTVEDIIAKRFQLLDKNKGDDSKFWSEFFLRATDPKGNFFRMDRIGHFPSSMFMNPIQLMDWVIPRHSFPVALWVEPGGAKSHGIVMVVLCFIKGIWYVLDIVIIRSGIASAAVELGKLIELWHIERWGVEGNFIQKEAFGHTLNRELLAYFERMGKPRLFRIGLIKNNTVDKFLRIQTGISSMMGLEGAPLQFYVNTQARGYAEFVSEVNTYPMKVKNHDYDILDAITSCRNHLLGSGGIPIIAVS